MLHLNNIRCIKKSENIYLFNFIKPFYKGDGDELVHNIHIQYSVYVNKVLNGNFQIKNVLENSSHFLISFIHIDHIDNNKSIKYFA